MYAVACRIIEIVGGVDAAPNWGTCVQRRMFQSLGMDRSCSDREDLPDQNFAEPHTALDNGKPGRLPIPDFPNQTITGASAAVWSTVPYMLKWSVAIFQRPRCEDGSHHRGTASYSPENPLRQMSRILAHRCRVTEDTVNENSYGLGWARHLLPSKHLGWLSINGPQPDHVIGRDSRPRLAFYHGGQITGYLNTVYLFPETDSAVVVLTNAQGAGGCSDWAAQAIIQELFDLEPKVDFHIAVADSAKTHLGGFQRMKDDYEKNRHKNTVAPPNVDIVGKYLNDSIRMTLDISNHDSGLVMQVNGRPSQRYRLNHYHYNVYGFMPATREEQQLRCLVDYFIYEQFLMSFQRASDSDPVTSLSWNM